MDIDFTFMLGQIPRFIDAAVVTIKVGVTVIITSLLVGLLNTILLYYRKGWVKRIVQLYVEVARNTPLLIQLFFSILCFAKLGFKVSGIYNGDYCHDFSRRGLHDRGVPVGIGGGTEESGRIWTSHRAVQGTTSKIYFASAGHPNFYSCIHREFHLSA